MSLRIKYWGVRGSLPSAPTPEQRFAEVASLLEYCVENGITSAAQVRRFLSDRTVPEIGGFGCHTTCAEVQSDRAQIIIDGGSGAKNLSDHLMRGAAGKGKGVFNIFLTHFHWDHLIGLPFFAPHFVKGNVINYYAVQPDLEDVIRLKFRKPMFPVPFEALSAKINFHRLEPRKPFTLEDMTITPYQLDHPDPCWGFRVEAGGRAYAHCVDTEGTRVSREAMGPDLPLYQNLDLMYFDAQYTLPELAEKANWGHSAAQLGLDIAFREKVKHVVFAHHDPGASTSQIFEIKNQTREYYDWLIKKAEINKESLHNVKWRYAYEGLTLDLDEL